MTLDVRPADRGDSRFIAWVIQESGRSHLESGITEFLLPGARQRLDFLDALQRTKTRSFFHGARFLVAESDGRVTAALSGYEGTGPYAQGPAAFEEAWHTSSAGRIRSSTRCRSAWGRSRPLSPMSPRIAGSSSSSQRCPSSVAMASCPG